MGKEGELYQTFGVTTSSSESSHESDTVEPASKMSCGQLGVLGVLCLGQFCLAACISLQAPFFPGEAQAKGVSATVYGMVFGVFELAVVISSPIYGKIIVFVKPRLLIVSGLFLAGISSILFGFLDKCPDGLPFILPAFALRIVEGLACAAVTTASYTVVATLFKDRVATVFSVLGTSFGIGLICGPTIGGLLYQAQGFWLPFFVVGIILCMATIAACITLPKSGAERVESGKIIPFLWDAGIMLNSMAIITSFMYIGYYTTNLELYLAQFSLLPAVVGVIFVITGSIYGITSPLWGWICDKGVNPQAVTVFGYLLSCISLILLGPAPFIPVNPKLWLIILALVIGGLGIAAKIVCSFIGSLQNAVDRGFPNDMGTHGLVSALFSSSSSFGAFVGPTLGGYLWDIVGFRMGSVVYLVDELVFMVLTLMYILWRRGKRSPESQPLLTEEEIETNEAPS